MKKVYCDICSRIIDPITQDTRIEDLTPLFLPVWNEVSQGCEVRPYDDVCPTCRKRIAAQVQLITRAPLPEAGIPAGENVRWMPMAIHPTRDGRYLVADIYLGKPRVSVALYYCENDEFTTNKLIHPEDLICWAMMPDIPDSYIPKPEPEGDDDSGND